MKSNLVNLEPRQLFAMYIAAIVRNAMESFHVEHLTDDQMEILNPIIRNAIYTALEAYSQLDDNEDILAYVNECFEMIPIYWEPPELLDGYVYMASGKWREDFEKLLAKDSDQP